MSGLPAHRLDPQDSGLSHLTEVLAGLSLPSACEQLAAEAGRVARMRDAALKAREGLPEALRRGGPFPREMGAIRKELR